MGDTTRGGLAFEGTSFGYGRGPTVLERLDWQVGRRVALLGPNGAGKSTLMALGSGALRPRTGAVTVAGRPVRAGAVGWMQQSIAAVPGLTAREQVALAGWMNGMRSGDAWREAAVALSRVDLLECEDVSSRKLSGGQLRRLGLAEVLVTRPRVLLLDEPTVGLDPAQRKRMRSLIADLPDDVQIVLATHLVDDIDSFEEVAVLVGGGLRFVGPVASFLSTADPGAPANQRAESAYEQLVSGDREATVG